MQRKRIRTGYSGQDLVLSLAQRKRLDILNAQKVQKAILKSARKKHDNVLLDLQNVHFIDSAAIAMLIEMNERLTGWGKHLYLTGITRETLELIRLVPALNGLIKASGPGEEPVPRD